MFANTQMMGADMRFPDQCKQQLFRIRSGIDQGIARGSLTPDAGTLLREMHGVLETVVAHSINQSSMMAAQQKMLNDLTRGR